MANVIEKVSGFEIDSSNSFRHSSAGTLEYGSSESKITYELDVKFIENNGKEEEFLPISIFNSESLSALEAISKFLKEEAGLRYCEIAVLLNRDSRTIWGAHNSAKQKMNEKFILDAPSIQIPHSIFKNRSFGALEAIVRYLKEELNLRYCQIASLLNRNDRTIWTVYQRAIKKVKNGNNQ